MKLSVLAERLGCRLEGDGSIEIRGVASLEQAGPGDVVITAVLSIGNDLKSLYPKGLILGKVVEVTKGENGTFQRAILVPAVDLRHLENVLVVNTSP